jgi:hypothetical protein
VAPAYRITTATPVDQKLPTTARASSLRLEIAERRDMLGVENL